MASPGDQNESASRLLFAARQFLDFATTSPIDEPDRLLKLIRLLDALNSAVIEVPTRVPADPLEPNPASSYDFGKRWPELNACYPTAALLTEQAWLDGDREADLASPIDDLGDICREIREGVSIAEYHDEQTAAKHLAWTYEAHWIWHIHGLRFFLAKRLLN